MKRVLLSLLSLLAAAAPLQALAASLRVAPVTLDLEAGRKTGSLTLTNGDERPVSVQARVFRWTQVGGVERLEPTTDVVASPPATTLAGGARQVMRLVRVTNRPITGEESYRVLIDELPDPARRIPGEISLVLRQSVPIFFSERARTGPKVEWRLDRTKEGQQLVARNSGGRRIRLNDLELRTAGGATVDRRAGLAGYVLAGAEMRWTVKVDPAKPGEPLHISAGSDAGAVHDTVSRPPGS